MRRQLVKDNAAEADLLDIWLYSFKNWGETQADRYINAIEAGVATILKMPEKGDVRDNIRKGHWSVRVGHHVAFYTFTDAEVRLRRVLHEAMDAGRHLTGM